MTMRQLGQGKRNTRRVVFRPLSLGDTIQEFCSWCGKRRATHKAVYEGIFMLCCVQQKCRRGAGRFIRRKATNAGF